MKESAHKIVKHLGHPVWHIGPRDSDIEISKTVEDLLKDESGLKLLTFDGNTHKFSVDTGNEMLSNFF